MYIDLNVTLSTLIGSSSTSIAVTSTNASSAVAHTQTQTPATKSSANIGAIAGGVVGGIVGLALICLVGFFVVMRTRRRGRQPVASDLPVTQGSSTFPTLQGAGAHGSPSSGPSMGPLAAGPGGNSAATFPSEAVGVPPTGYYPYPISPDISTTITDSSNPFSFVPPPTLPSTIERTAQQSSPSSNSQGEGSHSLYPAGVASYAASRSGLNVYQPLASQEDHFSPLPPGAGSLSEDDLTPEGYSRSEIDGWRDTVGSPAPPSYRTRLTR